MDGHEFEEMLQGLLKQDCSAGTEAFRDALLARCLEELDSEFHEYELDDEELEMLAAAGDGIVKDDFPALSNR